VVLEQPPHYSCLCLVEYRYVLPQEAAPQVASPPLLHEWHDPFALVSVVKTGQELEWLAVCSVETAGCIAEPWDVVKFLFPTTPD